MIIDSDNPLVYRSVGAEGRVDIKVTKEPGIWGSVYASHHPPLCKLDLRGGGGGGGGGAVEASPLTPELLP